MMFPMVLGERDRPPDLVGDARNSANVALYEMANRMKMA